MRLIQLPALGLLLSILLNPAIADVIPQPVSVAPQSARMLLPTPVNLAPVDAALAAEQSLLRGYLASVGIETTAPVGNVPGIGLALDPELGESAYRLRITDDGVVISGGDAAGALFGVQTLRQLLAQGEHTVEGILLSHQDIADRPRFDYRGMHLDVSRHFFDVSFIKRYIDLIALHKMNVFHWHLTDDQGWRLQSKAYPRLTQLGARRSGTVVGHSHDAGSESDGQAYGGHYSWDEVREVVAYAAQRHIVVVPEIDVPGHASAMIAAYPELGCGKGRAKVQTHFGVFPEILCPSNATFDFLQVLLAEVASLFPGPYIHIGGDEVRKDHWRDCARCNDLMREEGLADYAELQGWFVNRTESIVNKLGKRMIGWDEILDGEVRPSATVMSWRGTEGGIRAAKAGHDVIMTPLQHVYFDFYQGSSVDEPMAIHGLTRLSDVYAFNPLPAELSVEEQAHILGAQGNLWTEYVRTPADAERMVLPRMSALAEVLWSAESQQDFASFSDRLPAFESLLVELGYQPARSHYKPHLVFRENAAGGFEVRLESLAGDLRYRVNDADTAAYTGPFTVQGSATIHAFSVLPNGERLGDARLTLVDHLARNAVVRPFDTSVDWKPGQGRVLVDGQLATDRIFRYPEWYSAGPQGMDLVIELSGEAPVSSVSVGWQAGYHRKLFRPTALEVQVPEGGGQWRAVARLDAKQMDELTGNRLELRFTPTSTQQLRVIASNDQLHWSEEQSKNVPPTLRVDEIVVQ